MKKAQNLPKPPPLTSDCSLSPYEIEQDPYKGTGKILVSGTTVHGIDTKFLEELSQNDSLIVKSSNATEVRKVILVLSDKSTLISASFPEQITTEFFIQKPSVKVDPKEELESSMPAKKIKLENNEKTYEVRVKRGPWTYKTDQVKTLGKLTGEDLLNVRAQRVRDKFCWM